MSIAKEALGLGKGEFQKKLGNIVDAHRAGTKVIGKPRDFILTACRLTERYSKVANEEGVEVRLKNMKIGPRKVKCIHLKRKSDGFEQPVPRGQLINSLYPPRETVKKASPEKKHALNVRAAMRTAIDYQLRKFRKAVRLPAECVHTEKQIRYRYEVGRRSYWQAVLSNYAMSGSNSKASHILTSHSKVPQILKKFKDDKLQKHWILWHETHATFAPSLPKANRSQGAGDYQASEALLGSLKKEDPEDVDLDF